MGRKGSILIPFLTEAVKKNAYGKCLEINGNILKVKFPRKGKNMDRNGEQILKDWHKRKGKKPHDFEFSKEKQRMEASLRGSVFLERIEHLPGLNFKILSPEEIKDKRVEIKQKEIIKNLKSPKLASDVKDCITSSDSDEYDTLLPISDQCSNSYDSGVGSPCSPIGDFSQPCITLDHDYSINTIQSQMEYTDPINEKSTILQLPEFVPANLKKELQQHSLNTPVGSLNNDLTLPFDSNLSPEDDILEELFKEMTGSIAPQSNSFPNTSYSSDQSLQPSLQENELTEPVIMEQPTNDINFGISSKINMKIKYQFRNMVPLNQTFIIICEPKENYILSDENVEDEGTSQYDLDEDLKLKISGFEVVKEGIVDNHLLLFLAAKKQ